MAKKGAAESVLSRSKFGSGRGTTPEQKLEKKQLVLKTAARLICENGYDRTSLEGIANELGITKPTLYYYIKNKADIFEACRELSAGELEQVEALAETIGITADTKLTLVLSGYAAYLSDTFGRLWMHAQANTLPPDQQAVHNDAYKRLVEAVTRVVSSGIRSGVFRKVHAESAARSCLGALSWVAAEADVQSPKVLQRRIEETVEALLAGYLR